MKWILCFILLFISRPSKADAVYRAAMRYGQRAFFSYPATRKIRRDTEKYLFSLIPIERDTLFMVGGVCFTLLSGNLSTRSFNNLRVGVLGWNVSPELAMNIRTGQAFALISLNKEF